MRLPITAAVLSAGRYVLYHPKAVARLALQAATAKIPIPLDAFRWLAAQLPTGGGAPTEIAIEARPPGLSLGATLDVMGTRVRAGVTLRIDGVEIGPGRLQLTVGLSQLNLTLLAETNTPLAGLLKSGALDLSRPGNLLKMLPTRPEALVSATEDQLVIDLLKIPGVGGNAALDRGLRAVTPVANVAAIRTAGDVLLIDLRLSPTGIPAALAAARR